MTYLFIQGRFSPHPRPQAGHIEQQPYGALLLDREVGMLLPNNQRQHRTLHFQKVVLPYAVCQLLCPVPAALASIFRMNSIFTSYYTPHPTRVGCPKFPGSQKNPQPYTPNPNPKF